MKKITPSELNIKIGWLAGIVDGEGSIGHYNSKRKGYPNSPSPQYSVVIVNTDLAIINAVEDILTMLKIFYSTNIKSSSTKFREGTFAPAKDCYQVSVRRRLDVEKILKLLEPQLCGYKKQKATDLLKFFVDKPYNSKIRRVETK